MASRKSTPETQFPPCKVAAPTLHVSSGGDAERHRGGVSCWDWAPRTALSLRGLPGSPSSSPLSQTLPIQQKSWLLLGALGSSGH